MPDNFLSNMIAKKKETQSQEKPVEAEKKVKFNFAAKKDSPPVVGTPTPVGEKPEEKARFVFKTSSAPAGVKDEAENDTDGELLSISIENEAAADDEGDSVVEDDGTVSPSIDIDEGAFVFPDQPENYSQEAVEKLKTSLQLLTNCITDKQLVGQAINTIMRNLAEHEFLKDIMRENPEYIGLMVRGLRESYGTVVIKKKASAKKRTEKSAKIDETVNMLSDLNFFGEA